jgi:hypothetical protein
MTTKQRTWATNLNGIFPLARRHGNCPARKLSGKKKAIFALVNVAWTMQPSP